METLAPRKFTFAGSAREAKLEIQFQRELPNTHWILALESDSKVGYIPIPRLAQKLEIRLRSLFY